MYEKYERMYHNDIEARGKFDAELAKPSDIEEIYQILIGTFNPFSDTLPNRYEIGELIKQDSILVNRDHLSEKINGALLLRFEPQKCHIYIWVSSSNFNESLNLFFNGFKTRLGTVQIFGVCICDNDCFFIQFVGFGLCNQIVNGSG